MSNLKCGPFSVNGWGGLPLPLPAGSLLCLIGSTIGLTFSLSPWVFLPFYKSLLLSWRSLHGYFSASSNLLVFGSSSCHLCSSISNMSTEICDQYLLSETSSHRIMLRSLCPRLVSFISLPRGVVLHTLSCLKTVVQGRIHFASNHLISHKPIWCHK